MQSPTEKDLTEYITPTIPEVLKNMLVHTNQQLSFNLIIEPQQFLDFLYGKDIEKTEKGKTVKRQILDKHYMYYFLLIGLEYKIRFTKISIIYAILMSFIFNSIKGLDNDIILNLILNFAVFTHILILLISLLKLFKQTSYKIVAKRIVNVLDIIISFNFTDRCLN